MINYHVIVDTSEEDLRQFYIDIKGTRYEYLPILDINKLCWKVEKEVVEGDDGNPKVIETKVWVDPDIKFEPGHRYLVMGVGAYKYVKDHIHLGPRGENFYDMTKMEYCLTRNGSIFKFCYVNFKRHSEFISKAQYDALLPNVDKLQKRLKWAELKEGISKRTGRAYYMLEYYKLEDVNDEISTFLDKEELLYPIPQMKFTKLVRTKEEIIEAFKFLKESLARKGLDYETSGFPFDNIHFYHMGVGITTAEGEGFYFDMDYMQRVRGKDFFGRACERMPWEAEDPKVFEVFLKEYKEYLDLQAEQCYAYNVGFEQRATYLLYKVLYFFHEGSSINKLESLVKKNYSLKFTAMRSIHVASWDDDFEWLTDTLPEIFEEKDPNVEHKPEEVYYTNDLSKVERWELDENGEVSAEEKERLDCETRYFTESGVWAEICERFPEYLDEFEWLIKDRWGDPFKCIPAPILAKYCCLDSFHTVLLHEEAIKTYTETAWNCFDNNLRLGALLNIHGIPLDEEYRQKLEEMSTCQILNSKLQLCKWYLNYQLNRFKGLEITDEDVKKVLNPKYLDLKSLIDGCSSESDPMKLLHRAYLIDNAPKRVAKWIYDYFDGARPDEWDKKFQKDYNELLAEDYQVISVEGERSTIVKLGEDSYEYPYTVEELKDFIYFSRTIEQVEFLIERVDQTRPQLVFQFMEYDGTITERDGYEISAWIKDDIYNFNSSNNFMDMSLMVYNYYHDPCMEMMDWDEESQFESDEEIDERMKRITEITEEFLSTPTYEREFVKTDKFGNPLTEDGEPAVDEEHPAHVETRVATIKEGYIQDYQAYRYEQYLREYLESLEVEECLCRKTRTVFDERTGLEREEAYLEKYLFDVKNSEPWRHYQQTGDILTCFMQLCEVEGLLWTPDVELNDEGGIIRHFPGPCLEEPYWEIPEQTSSGQSIYWLSIVSARDRVIGNYTTKKALERVYEGANILDKSILGLTLWQYHFTNFRKYEKVLSTYINGQFTKYTTTVNDEDGNMICTERWWDEEKTNHLKVFSPFRVCEKQSKRWSAPTHTIPSKSEVKRCITTPPGYLLSYFDISGAEVRTVAFLAKSKFFMDCYDQHKDVYIEAAKIVEPGEDPSYYKSRRPVYKQILLGKFFGMSDEKLAEMTESELADSIERSKSMFDLMPEVDALIQEKGEYCVRSEGVCETVLGDKMFMENKRRDQWSRLGINQVIQGFTAIALADGFFNNIYVSYKEGKVIIRPVNVVHDSSQNLFETKHLFEICQFYTKNMQQYLFEKYAIDWAFEVEVGVNYYDMVEVSNIDERTLELEGTYTALYKLLQKIREDGLAVNIVKCIKGKDEELPLTDYDTVAEGFEPDVPAWGLKQSISQFKVAAMYEFDKSKYKLIITKA